MLAVTGGHGAHRPGARQAAGEKKVNIFFWYDYVPPKLIEEFEAETGIKVVYDTFDSTEMLTTRRC